MFLSTVKLISDFKRHLESLKCGDPKGIENAGLDAKYAREFCIAMGCEGQSDMSLLRVGSALSE